MFLYNALVVILVEHLYFVLGLDLREGYHVFRLVRVRINNLQLVRKNINVVDHVLRLLPAVFEGVCQCRTEMLEHLCPLNIDFGEVLDARLLVRPRLVESLHLINEVHTVQITTLFDHVVFYVNWSAIVGNFGARVRLVDRTTDSCVRLV